MPADFITYSFAKRNGILVEKKEKEDKLSVIISPYASFKSIIELRRHLAEGFTIKNVDAHTFETYLQKTYEYDAIETIKSIDGFEESDLTKLINEIRKPEDLLESADDAPIIRLLNGLLAEAVRKNASDIHIEPFENRISIRFRIDGNLKQALEPPYNLVPLIISRIKIMASLDIAEKRLPQDGRISLLVGGSNIDVRVSTIPVGKNNERVVMRLLYKQETKLNLKNLGMPDDTRKNIEKIIANPYGIILVTGPTGSGKTTTLYAILSYLNNKQSNIMTVEDPIEFYIDGINQTQVNFKIDMSFARGLRAILRQDPDIIMVGEIRDLETARIAVQASLTGHLVFSTLHTNTAVGVITRLKDMGLEPFLLASSLNGALAQRLLRLLCDHCKQPVDITDTEADILRTDTGVIIYKARGCRHCDNTGYKGRIGVYELVEIDDNLRSLINKNSTEQEIEHCVRKKTASIQKAGFDLVLKGLTSLEEALRVLGDND